MAATETGTRDPEPAAETRHAANARLSDAMASVAEFHQAFGAPRAALPDAAVPAELAKLRVDLLAEETGEFADATAAGDIVGIADALADIIYVAYGAAIVYGIDLDAVFAEVHRSNMTKLDERGMAIYREDGKVLKSDRYTPPDIKGVLSRQPPLPF
jgi:predicted HAD superfamily Cof-like phosphohydrolase